MLRALFASIVVLFLVSMPALAGPELSDDVATCRQYQPDPKTRQDACERVIAAGQATGKDLATALAVRGNALFNKRDNDKAIAAYTDALKADPDNAGIINSRG